MKNPLRTLPLFAGLAWACGQAFGQDAALPADPTRPPSVASEAAPANANVDAGPAAVGLQTIILRSGGKSMAVINGVQVKIGDKVGDATLVQLSETEAVLKGPSGRQVLHLMPGIEKHGSAKTLPVSGAPGDRRASAQPRAQADPAH